MHIVAITLTILLILAIIAFAGLPSIRITGRMVVLRLTLGVVFFILGIVGSLLPVLQGWLFFLLSALMFFPNSRFTSKVLVKAEPKMPRVVGWLRRLGIGAQ